MTDFELNKSNIKKYWRFMNPNNDSFVFQAFKKDGNATKQYYINSEKDLLELCEKHNLKGISCLSINPRKENKTGIESVKYLNTILIDIDVKKKQKENGISTEENKKRAREVVDKVVGKLKEMGFSPDLIVDSGNGYHIYCKTNIRLPFFSNREEWKETVLYRKILTFEEKLKELETEAVEIDHITKDAARRVKIPGTWNVKQEIENEENYRRAEIVKKGETDEETNNNALKELEAKKEERKKETKSHEGKIETSDKKINWVLKHDERFRELYAGRATSEYKSRSEAELALACKAVYYDFDVDKILSDSYIGKWNEANKGYRKITEEKAHKRMSKSFDWEVKNKNGTPGTGKHKSRTQKKHNIPLSTSSLRILNTRSNSSTQQSNNIKQKYEKGWQEIIARYHETDTPKKQARYETARFLLDWFSFKTHPKTDIIYVFNSGTYEPKGKKIVRNEIRNFLGPEVTNHDLNEIVSTVGDVTYVNREEFEQEELMINVENADIKVQDDGSLEVMDIDPDRLVLSRIPWEYDTEADCPKIKEFLHEILKDDWIPTVQEMAGLCLANKYLTRKAFMLYGDGSNGKDILLSLIEELLTKKNISNHTLHHLERNRFAAAGLVGKLANISGDLSEKELKTSSVFKRITGGSSIEMEPKGKDSFNYNPYSTMIFAANTTPTFKEDNYALFDRWVIITFPYKFTDDPDDKHKDKMPREKLLSELSSEEEMRGFLKWAVDGLERLKKNDNVLTNQQSSEEIRESWMERSDSITAFAKKKIESEPENVVTKRDVYNKYRDWCVENNYTPEAMQAVGKRLPTKTKAKKGQRRVDGKKAKVWEGIKIVGSESSRGNEGGKKDVTDYGSNKVPQLLEFYPEKDPANLTRIKSVAVEDPELDISEEEFDKIHKSLKSEGEIFEAKGGWKKNV